MGDLALHRYPSSCAPGHTQCCTNFGRVGFAPGTRPGAPRSDIPSKSPETWPTPSQLRPRLTNQKLGRAQTMVEIGPASAELAHRRGRPRAMVCHSAQILPDLWQFGPPNSANIGPDSTPGRASPRARVCGTLKSFGACRVILGRVWSTAERARPNLQLVRSGGRACTHLRPKLRWASVTLGWARPGSAKPGAGSVILVAG